MEPFPPPTPEALAAHRLLIWPGLGSATALGLYRTLGSFARAFTAPLTEVPERWRAPVRDCRAQDEAALAASRAALTPLLERGVFFLLCLADPGYPALLRETPSPPPLLYGCGNPAALALPAIAVVGSRNASRAGVEHAARFAAALAGSGFAIASGLALGIDSAAHLGALKTGITLAVVGTGIDRVYPRQHLGLWRDIVAAGGAVVSEFPPGTPPLAGNFPRRNRIISGLSLGVLVVEAALRSGSLITARQALEQGREVFAIPGSINNPLARGCHQLIREGAALVETADDIVAQLGGMLAFKAVEARAEPVAAAFPASPEALQVLAAMGHDPADVDLLVARTGLPVAGLTAALVELELAGRVEHRDGHYSRLA
ncbi:MAG: DNA-processing protein DprA [Porticoccaceae bacterium]